MSSNDPKNNENTLLVTLNTKRSEVLGVLQELKIEISKSTTGDPWCDTLVEMRDDFVVQLGLLAEAINKLEEAVEFSNQKLTDVQEMLDTARVTIGEEATGVRYLVSSYNRISIKDPQEQPRQQNSKVVDNREFKKKAY